MTHAHSDPTVRRVPSVPSTTPAARARNAPARPDFLRIGLAAILLAIACSGCQPSSPSSGPAQGNTAPSASTPTSIANAATDPPKPDSPSSQPSSQPSSPSTSSSSFDEKLANADRLLQSGDAEGAWRVAKELIVERPQSAPALFLAARSMAARGNVKGAIQTLSKIDPNDRDAGPAATGQLAEWLAQSGDLLGAETKLLSLIQSFPTAVPALRLLVDIYHAQGRRWEAAKYLERLIRLGNFGTPDLMHSIDFRDPVDQETLRTAAERFAPDEPTSKLHALRVLAYADRWADAVGPLRSLVESRPDWLEPWIWYGEALLETQQTDALSTWLQHRPNGWEQHPEFWYILGRTMQLQDQHDQAARCFAEALQRDRRHVASMQSLAESLMELQQPELALQVRERAGKLVRIKDLSLQIQRGHGKRQEFVDIANLYRELEDAVGAFGWDAALLASEKQPFPPELVATQQRLRTGAKVPNPWLDGLNVAAWPMPALDALPSPTEKPRASISSGGAIPIQFRDVANELGIDARYNNGAPEGRGWYTHEGLGGGVSALDYDRDGWPDLFFSQAGDHPNATPPKYLPKQLFRSLQSQRFVDVAGLARIADLGYGQGTGVVDLDQDGFQDLLIADIGEIKCYRNQGDGTFERWELPQAPAPAIWNSAIQGADINADGLPDIIQCAYIHGTDFLTRTCASSSDSKLLFCHPKRFEPGHTRILINAGDGRFNLLDAAILDALVDGYALGTIITNIDQRFGNDIYFANDVSANHLLLSQASRAGKADLDEVAMRAGVAVDSLGRPQASMGVACGDQNRDGLLDLIVTNFRFEVSTLYLQTSPGVFRDGTRGSRLGEATFEWLSFGCQLSDLDNDGWLDFITVNGHIDFLDPWQMPPQVLHNRQGQFQWLRTPSPGAYFDVDNVGRSLTMTDFNRDGRLDFAITHLDRRAALLRNDSPREDRHWLQLELIGTVSERDATGAIIHLRSGAEEWVVPVAVGDGYYGTNERIVHVGVGSAKQIDALEIAWPSGHSDSVRDVPVDRRVRCIESQGVTAVELLSPP